ncbi:MAG: TlyA family RNA methyltransferase [Nitrospiraceae bacterium]|nr:TlyA family RNA methyltransferase [Nitrospiraceae bacterium]
MKKEKRKRLDLLIFERGLAESRQKAAALVLGGMVQVDGRPCAKAGTMVEESAQILVRADERYASRGALKLKGAALAFGVSFAGKVVMDVGCSSGGFTDYMLREGAIRVYCIDVGYGQLYYKLREDPRVRLLEKTNIRLMERGAVPEEIDLATIDVSFISLRLVLPRVAEFLKPGGEVLALVKPQFEVGRDEVGKGGVVRSEAKRKKAVLDISEAARAMGFALLGVYECEVRGQKKGNIEYFIYLGKDAGEKSFGPGAILR